MSEILMNGVKVNLKNPGTDGLKDFLIVNKSLSRMPKIDLKGLSPEEAQIKLDKEDVNFMDFLDDRAIDSLKNLITLSLNKTFKEVTEEIDQWAMENFMELIGEVIQMCSPKQPTDDEDRKEKVLDRINNATEPVKE